MSNSGVLLAFSEMNLFAYKLPFKSPMSFKQHQLQQREGLILQLIDTQGVQHFTEIAPLPGFSDESFAQVKVQMCALCSQLCLTKNIDVTKQYTDYPSIQFALDALFLSFNSTKQDADTSDIFDNVALLQGSSTAITAQYQRLGKPSLVKLKVARGAVDIDINNFQQLCKLNPALKIRCDANQAWSEQQATQFLSAINVEQLDYIEEPTSNHQSNLQLADRFSIHLGLDETLQRPNFNYQHHAAIRALIIKPTLIGSKEKIDKLVSIAKQFALRVSFSSSFESVVGIQQLKKLAFSYRAVKQQKPLFISLGIDTLNYFDGTLLMNHQHIEQDCQQLELLCSSNH